MTTTSNIDSLSASQQNPIYLKVGYDLSNQKGFINIDHSSDGSGGQLPVTNLPFEACSAQGIYSKNFIEHLSEGEAITFLRECRRVLNSDGTLRIVVPLFDTTTHEHSGPGKACSLGTNHDLAPPSSPPFDLVRSWAENQDKVIYLAKFAGLVFLSSCNAGSSIDPTFLELDTDTEPLLVMEFKKGKISISENPLVTIVIPAYKHAFFEESLNSAIIQTYSNIEILVLDDSPSDGIEHISTQLAIKDPRISYHKNSPPLGEAANLTKGIQLAKGEFIKPLYDDDVLLPDAVERLVEAFRQAPDAKLAAGRRLAIDSDGTLLDNSLLGPPLATGSGCLNGVKVIAAITAHSANFIGEPTVMMFRKSDALDIDEPNVMSLFGYLCLGLGDVCLASHLLSRGDLAYVAETIALFRIHPEQTQRQEGFRDTALAAWDYFRKQMSRIGMCPPAAPASLTLHRPGKNIILTHQQQPHSLSLTGQILVSAVVMCYQQRDVVRKTLESLLLQDYPIDEIIISDDCSTDGTLEVIQALKSQLRLRCNHLIIRQNPTNLGIVGHFNTLFELARNEFIVYFAGDDISETNRVRRLAETYLEAGCPRYFLIHSDVRMIREVDRPGEIFKPPVIAYEMSFPEIALSQGLHIGATAAFTRALWADYGGFEEPWVYEDLILGWRAAMHGHYHYLPECLLHYRAGGVSFQIPSPDKQQRHLVSLYRQRLADTKLAEAAGLRSDLGDIQQQLSESLNALESEANVLEFALPYNRWHAARQILPEEILKIEQNLALTVETGTNFQILLRLPENATSALADTLDALNAQYYPNWRLDIVSPLAAPDGLDEIPCIGWHTVAPQKLVTPLLNELVASHALEWIIELPPGAQPDPLYLLRLTEEIRKNPEAVAYFVDDDLLDSFGKHRAPRFKPGTNPSALKTSDLAGPLCIQLAAWQGIGGYPENVGNSWFLQLLRIADLAGWPAIRHIPDVLISYHDFPRNDEYCLNALREHLEASHLPADIQPDGMGNWHIKYTLPDPVPPVSIAILSRGHHDFIARCVENLLQHTQHPSRDILILLDPQTTDPGHEEQLTKLHAEQGIRCIKVATGDNRAKLCNAAIENSAHEWVVLLDEEVVVLQPKWLEELLSMTQPSDVVAVTPRMISAGTAALFNAGTILGLEGLAGTPYYTSTNLAETGNLNCMHIARDVSGLPTGCFLIRKSAYLAVNGMDEELGNHFPEIDLAVKLRQQNHRIVYQPKTTLVFSGQTPLPRNLDEAERYRDASLRAQAEATLNQRWGKNVLVDPYWNQNLSLQKSAIDIETAYRPQWQYLPTQAPRFLARTLPNGQGYFRVESQLRALRNRRQASECVWDQRDLREPTPAELMTLAPDTLIVQHYVQQGHLVALNKWHRIPGRPFIVYALDDLLTDLPKTNHFRRNIPPNSWTHLKYALDRCDRLVVSTDFLAATYKDFIDDIRVVPNCLEPSVWLPLRTRKRTSPKPRIGWAGGTTHEGDLMLLREVIEQTHTEADWIFFGMCPESLRPLVAEYHPIVPFHQYPAQLAALNLDIAVAPLENHPFNQGKSNLRLLEYGILGIPVVCSDIDPYRNSTACCVRNTTEAWVEALRARIYAPDARETEGREMKRWVQQNHLLDDRRLTEWLSAHLPS